MFFSWWTSLFLNGCFICLAVKEVMVGESCHAKNSHKLKTCWIMMKGVCVSTHDTCPFTDAIEIDKDKLSLNMKMCGMSTKRCCAPQRGTHNQESRMNGLCGTHYKNHLEYRIFGGHSSNKGVWPWHVNLFKDNIIFYCGGSLIHPKWVLTAAHCFDDINTETILRDFKVIAGNYNRDLSYQPYQIVNISHVFRHIHYNISGNENHDLALLELERELKISEYVNTICLPNVNEDFQERVCTVTGFGLTDPYTFANDLQELDVPTLLKGICQRKFPKSSVDANIICGANACSGDSGGPLMCEKKNTKNENQYIQAGIVAFGRNQCDIQ